MQLQLRRLEPQFIRCGVELADECHGRPTGDGGIQWGGFPVDVQYHVSSIQEADGITFLCPLCFFRNGGPEGTHAIAVYFQGRNAPPHIGVNSEGRTSRWEVRGNDYLDLTLSPSIWLKSGCGWHGWVEHGVCRNA